MILTTELKREKYRELHRELIIKPSSLCHSCFKLIFLCGYKLKINEKKPAKKIILLLILMLVFNKSYSQCLSAANPVGGTENLLTLEKNTIRVISFYKYNYGNQYFEENKESDFNLINKAYYNYIGTTIGYGITQKFSIETETGYFINKTQQYNLSPSYSLVGVGFSNIIVSGKYGIYSNLDKRIFFSASAGIKIPSSTKPQTSNNVELPIEVQSSAGAYGVVTQAFLVQENSGKGLRYFITNRTEINQPNRQNFKIGTSLFTSIFISKHIMNNNIKGDWTTILQIRNEIRLKNKRDDNYIQSSGSNLFFISPQVNYSLKEKWDMSLIVDIPCYQFLNGIQLATKYGITFSVARDLKL